MIDLPVVRNEALWADVAVSGRDSDHELEFPVIGVGCKQLGLKWRTRIACYGIPKAEQILRKTELRGTPAGVQYRRGQKAPGLLYA